MIMNMLDEHAMLREIAPGLIAFGIEHGWVVRPVWPPQMDTIMPKNKTILEYNRMYSAKRRAANRAKGLTSAGTKRLRRPNGTVPKGSAYMAAFRHGELPKFRKRKAKHDHKR